VLIVKISSLGDIIHTLPAITDASRAHRDIVFDWVVEENFAEIPGWHPAVATVIPVAIRRWRRNWLKTYLGGEFGAFRRQLQTVHYDLVIDAQGLIKSGLISRLSKGITVGLANNTIREPLATLFYNKVYSVPWTSHAIDRVRELFSRALQYQYDREVVDYGLLRQRLGIDPLQARQDTLVFLHGTTWDTKHWPAQYWRRLAAIASGAGYRVALPWGSSREQARARFIAEDISGVEVLPRQTLTGLARQIAQAAGVVAVDTGLGHLAAALGTPAVSLYGATDPGLSGTLGEHQLHLTSTLGCAPCKKKHCVYTSEELTDEVTDEAFAVLPPCFHSLPPERVWQQLQGLLGRS
jgi:heptosyltransferase-1